MKKCFSAFVAALALTCSCALAQETAAGPADPAAAAAVRELLASMKYRELMNRSLAQMADGVPAMMMKSATAAINARASLSDADKKKALDQAVLATGALAADMHKMVADPALADEIIAEMVPLYARHFTVAELRGLADFYRTPLGAKALSTMPQIMNESLQIGQRIMAPRIKKYVQEAGMLRAPR